MNALLRATVLAFAASACLPALAESCHVSAQPEAKTPPSNGGNEYCFEHEGMPEGSLDWSCNNKTGDVAGMRKEKRQTCPSGYFGRCVAPLTQETLANEMSSGRYGQEAGTPPNVPDEAKIVTYYYQALDKGQAKVDCESGGGRWTEGDTR
ncbi:hypothetical protein [Pseudomonas indica]|uniref:hypothetical protein n=1 Tax=Pseudomonas indica TaxID=137658 RepID=UPI000BAB6209|nr:hypothetical protein [Pseudomonas indica]PAU57540.1 hypothetical protein BZL42_14250 [Pseudomonas indica]